ncbi:hypothetical protein HYDPIDRAFT_110574 [Hydnomerulius pinastri MD-312]|nr:hypothetical protein HYDPIDRAFT_110574 [Hydnomerulius pinastri MD-312]
MDNSPALSRATRNDASKPPRGHRTSDKHTVEDTPKVKPPAPAQRSGTRYKEKFQALKERFDQVSAQREEYERDLELANARMRKLQAENDLLLDAISITVPATPSLMHLIRPSPTATSSSAPLASYTHPPPPPPHAPHHHTNGHGHSHAHGHANGRYRDREREHDRGEPNDLSPHELGANGRPS